MLGGGQLGRMFCHAAQRLGYRVAVLDPDPDSPAGAVADRHIQTGYDDPVGLDQLAAQCRAITTEFENIPAQTLATLAQRVTVRPGADAVSIAQDRIREKAFFVQSGVAVAPYAEIRGTNDIRSAPDSLFPGILKAARFGYDGKGQARVLDRQQAIAALKEFGAVDCVLEALLPLAFEVSIVLARNHSGAAAHYPPIRNEHREGILAVSSSDALALQPDLAQSAVESALVIAETLNYVGVLCVEFFVLDDGTLLVNEVAPRPHNSGHYTLDASITSQFEQQVRVLAGMPLGSSGTTQAAIMLNLLGDLWFEPGSDQPREPAWGRVLDVDGAHLHLYGKSSVRKGRKMGHINVVGSSPAKVQEAAAQVAEALGMSWNS